MAEKDLNNVATAGVFAEFCDSLGNVVAQEVYFDWQETPLPDVGDVLSCTAPPAAKHKPRVLLGKVRARHFDVQRGDEGEPRVWVRLVLDVCSSQRLRPSPTRHGYCSVN